MGLCLQSLGRSGDALNSLVRGLQFAQKANDRMWSSKVSAQKGWVTHVFTQVKQGLETVGLFHLRVLHDAVSALRYFQLLLLESQRAEGEGHTDQVSAQRMSITIY